MSYSEPPRTNWGSILAGAFLFLLGLPILAGMMLAGPCLSPDGCTDKRIVVLGTAVIVVIGTFAISWLVNFIVRKFRND